MAAEAIRKRMDSGLLQQFVGGLIEGVVLLDPDGSIRWANAAALAMHDCVRATQLGGNAVAYRKRFALHYLNHHALKAAQYPVARLAAGEAFDAMTTVLTKCGGGEFHRVLQWRGLQLRNAEGAVESLALGVKDISEAISADERFERTFAANPAPAAILRLADSRYIKVNQGFLGMTGFSREAVLERPLHELDVLRKAEHRDEAVAALREHRTIAQQEAVLRRADGQDKFVIVAGQPIELDGDACMLFTFNDLDGRKQAEASLRDSEERFAKAFQLAPVPMLVCVRQGWRVLVANAAFGALTGLEAPELAANPIQDLGFWKGTRVLDEVRANLDAKRDIRSLAVPLHTRSGGVLDCLLSVEPVTIQHEACVLCVVQDVTERKRSEADLVAAIETVMKDTSWFSHTVMEKLAQIRRPGANASGLELLTRRERDVLERLCKGQTDADIAKGLRLSRNTVRNHVANLYGKLGVNRRSAAVVWGRERGLAAY